MSEKQPLREGQLFTEPLFSEPMRVGAVRSNGPQNSVTGLGNKHSERFRTVAIG